MTDHPIVASMAVPGGITVEIEQEMISYTTMYPYEADPAWVYTDQAGHHHSASRTTLVWYVTRTYYCADCRDDHEEGEWRCVQCGEVIVPGRRYIGHGPHMVPGLRSGTLHADDSQWRLTAEEMLAMPQGPYAAAPEDWDAWLARVRTRPADRVVFVSRGWECG